MEFKQIDSSLINYKKKTTCKQIEFFNAIRKKNTSF